MKNLILILMFPILISCSVLDVNRIAPGYAEAYNAIKLNVLGYDNEIDPDLISNIPYASMIVKIGKGPNALMILESVNNNEYTWVSADGVYLVIKQGRIIKTLGLPNNLSSRLDPNLSWNERTSLDKESISYLSFQNPILNNLKVTSTFKVKDYQDIDLIFGEKELRLIEENIESDTIAWYASNNYWLDVDNYIWKSTQYISPKLPPIHFEVTKKPL